MLPSNVGSRFDSGVSREAGARVGTSNMVRDMDLLPQDHQDGRRLEVVADGLPLFHGAQVAIDTTLVSLVSRDVSRAHGAVRQSQTARWRGGWKMVLVDTGLLETARQGQSSVWTCASASSGKGSVCDGGPSWHPAQGRSRRHCWK